MISVRQIVILAEQGQWRRLARQILANGRLSSLAVDGALMDDQAVAACALALALQRCCELTYGPTEETACLASRLLRLQDGGSGRFAPASPHWLTATAMAVRALADYQQRVSCTASPRLAAAVDRAVDAVRLALRPIGANPLPWRCSPETSIDRPTVALILCELDGAPAIRHLLPLTDLRQALDALPRSPFAAAASSGASETNPADGDAVTRLVLAAA